jgi:hypothetical protein
LSETDKMFNLDFHRKTSVGGATDRIPISTLRNYKVKGWVTTCLPGGRITSGSVFEWDAMPKNQFTFIKAILNGKPYQFRCTRGNDSYCSYFTQGDKVYFFYTKYADLLPDSLVQFEEGME